MLFFVFETETLLLGSITVEGPKAALWDYKDLHNRSLSAEASLLIQSKNPYIDVQVNDV